MRIKPYISTAETSQYRIIGGTEVAQGRFPYLVTLINRVSDTVMYQVCGGILIAQQWVLSAAHCLDKVNSVQIGRDDLKNSNDVFEFFTIKEKYKNAFVRESYDYDYALLHINGSSKYSWATLNYDKSIPQIQDILTVIGWGVTGAGTTSAVANEAGVEYIDNSACNEMYQNEIITSRMLCAGSPGKDACQGDSGGPLVLKGESAQTDIVVGVVSWGYGCADSYHPGVYARISEEIEWIQGVVCDTTPSSCYQMGETVTAGELKGTWSGKNVNTDELTQNATLMEIKPPPYGSLDEDVESSQIESSDLLKAFRSFDKVTQMLIICSISLVLIAAIIVFSSKAGFSLKRTKSADARLE